MPIAAFLMAISWPIVSRVLLALGLGTVTYTGASAALTGLLNSAKSSMSGMVPEVAQLLAMAGGFEAMSIIAGGIVSGLTFMVLKRFALQSTGSA